MSELIDTTEMYLRTIFELEEEGIVPLRARIAQRLRQSGPTVSQTVARMERDGLLIVQGDRHLELTADGRALATRVMRKHRLAERLLIDVIGLDWGQAHVEACRWEHVMSEAVERRLVELLEHPTESPYGNPIPGLDELGDTANDDDFAAGLVPLDQAVHDSAIRVIVRRIAEPVQADVRLMADMHRAGIEPGAVVSVQASPGGVLVARGHETVELSIEHASHVFVAALAADRTMSR